MLIHVVAMRMNMIFSGTVLVAMGMTKPDSNMVMAPDCMMT